MTSGAMGTTREPARLLVRGVAGFVIAAAVLAGFWMDHIGSAILTIFWALVLMGPVLAWPLTWGPLLGRGSMGIGVICIILTGYLRASPGEIAVMIGVSVPFFVIGVLLMVPQHLVALARSLIHR